MKVDKAQNDNTIYITDDKNDTGERRTSSSKESKKNGNIIFAGNLNLNDDTVNTKNHYKKQALKTLIDQYKNEKKIDDKVSTLRDDQKQLLKDADLAASQISNLKSLKQELKASYGISDDSEEQKNLDLLEKSIFKPDKMTKDELSQLQKMGPLTDYQKDALKYDSMQLLFQQRIDDASNDIFSINHAITSIGLERLKTHPMVDAQKEAAKILEAALKEVVGSLLKDGKEDIDKTAAENKEEIQKEQEEQAEKDDDADKASKTDPSVSGQRNQLQFADELKRIVEKQNMLEEDIKGILVNEKL